MSSHKLVRYPIILAALCLLELSSIAQTTPLVCTPTVSAPIEVASPAERLAAGRKAQPPLTDTNNGFAWPDTPLTALKTGTGYAFFASDGGLHSRQMWQGHWVGNDKYGSVVRTVGTLQNPLGSGDPEDVSISPNPDPSVNPNYRSYTYMGGGSVYLVPEGMPGAGNLLLVYHAEVLNDALYAVLGLASSTDNGLTWTDLGEIIRLNQAFEFGLDGFEIGAGGLVPSPDGQYFYIYFPDWIANGTLHATTTTRMSVARASMQAVLQNAFNPTRPHAVAFQKYFHKNWDLQPGISGASTDLNPTTPYSGYLDVAWNSALARYIMIISNDTTFAYAESTDALNWTVPISIGDQGDSRKIAAYPTAVGMGDNAKILGKNYYIYFTRLLNDGTGWEHGSLQRVTVTCP
jgi:hypothetical protein